MNSLRGEKYTYYHQQEAKLAVHLEAPLRTAASSVLRGVTGKYHSEAFKQIRVMTFFLQSTNVSLRNHFWYLPKVVFAFHLNRMGHFLSLNEVLSQAVFNNAQSLLSNGPFPSPSCAEHLDFSYISWASVQLFLCDLCSIYWNDDFILCIL